MKLIPALSIVIGVILLGGLFVVLKPNTPSVPLNTQQPTNPPQQASPSTTITTQPTFDLVIKNKEIISGPSTIQVNQGDTVTITITADEAEEFHLHAYDKVVELEPNKKATVTFTADLSGRFPFELEHSQTELGVIEVQPK